MTTASTNQLLTTCCTVTPVQLAAKAMSYNLLRHGMAASAIIKSMGHVYLFTLEIVPLEVGATYDELPSHLTLMSRFLSELTPEELSATVQTLFADTKPISLIFGDTVKLGPKKLIAHMVDSPEERFLHEKLQALLHEAGVTFQYPQFIGANHKAHVTHRNNIDFPPETRVLSSAVYLIEITGGQRIICLKCNLGRTI